MSATTDARPTHVGPIVGGADRDARYEAAVAQVHEHFGRRRADLLRARQVKQAEIDDRHRAFGEQWGVTGGDRRQIDNRPQFDVAERAHRQTLDLHRNAISAINAELEQLPRQEGAAVARLGAQLVDGPDVDVPDLVLPSLEDDTVLRELQAQRAAATSSRQALHAERDALYAIVTDTDRALALVTDRARFDLASKAEVAAARKAAGDAQARHHRAISAIDDLTTEIDGLERRIAERTVIVERERDHRVARELEEALFAAADALVPAMAAATRLKRAVSLTASDLWTPKALNLDEPRSVGRAFLQQAMEAGWVPSGTKE